jgi:hypothetical protein
VQEVHESQRADTANSLVYEANLRLRDPVYGCMGAILTLQQQVQALEAELAAARAEIVRHRYRPPVAAASAAVATVLPSSHASQLLAASAGRGLPAARSAAAAARTATLAALSSSSSTVYTTASNSTDYSSITNENVPYFGCGGSGSYWMLGVLQCFFLSFL